MGKERGMKKAARGRRTREKRCRETCRSADGRRANRKYKDRLFIRIFEDREDLLRLYNAVNASDYPCADDLEVTTLDNAIYMRMKNDVSFLIDGYMSLYEHQSTFNPNMPLRDCLYLLELYQNYIDSRELDLYSSVLLKIPAPRLVVFYNGQEKMRDEEECILRLSDAYERPEEDPALECIVRVININYGKNRQMMEKCPKLFEYAYLVAKIRENQAAGKTLEGAIGEAVKECLEQGYLTELLTNYRREVMGMLLYEYDEKKHLRNTYEEGRQEGRREGRQEGRREGLRTGAMKGRQKKSYESARNMYRRGFPVRDTAEILEEKEETVAAWYKKWEKR